MKFTIDIECTPEEARQFLGLPDVQEFQKAMMAEIQSRMSEQLQGMDSEAMMKNWLPTGMQAWDGLQEAFMKGFSGAGGGSKDEGKS